MEDFNDLTSLEKARQLRKQGREARHDGRDDLTHGYVTQSLHLFRGHADREGETEALLALADLALHFNPTGENGFARRKRLCEEALAIYRSLGHRLGSADALRLLATVVPRDDGTRMLEESLEIARAEGDTNAIAWSLDRLAAHLAIGQPEKARAYREQALELHQKGGDRRGAATALFGQAISWMNRDPERGRACAEKALDIYRELGERKKVAQMLMFLPSLCDDTHQNTRYLTESREICREIGVRIWEAGCLRSLASIAEQDGDAVQASALNAEADAIYPKEPLDPEWERRLQEAFAESEAADDETEPEREPEE